ncbi:MAG: hypothetical protein IJW67_05775 [Blautia sp.]|nr:hypothetical protein [Blautia sp.]
MERLILKRLEEWEKSPYRKPLILADQTDRLIGIALEQVKHTCETSK